MFFIPCHVSRCVENSAPFSGRAFYEFAKLIHTIYRERAHFVSCRQPSVDRPSSANRASQRSPRSRCQTCSTGLSPSSFAVSRWPQAIPPQSVTQRTLTGAVEFITQIPRPDGPAGRPSHRVENREWCDDRTPHVEDSQRERQGEPGAGDCRGGRQRVGPPAGRPGRAVRADGRPWLRHARAADGRDRATLAGSPLVRRRPPPIPGTR
jgi:hypothetical protein